MTVVEVLALFKELSLAGALLFVLIGGYKRAWVWGWAYEEALRSRDEWKLEARANMTVARRYAEQLDPPEVSKRG